MLCNIVKMEAAWFFETLVIYCKTRRRQKQEDVGLNSTSPTNSN